MEKVLKKWGATEVTPMELYSDMFKFGDEYIQKSGEASGEFKANPVAYWKNDDAQTGHFRIMFEDTFEETLEELQKADFSILNGITYFGRKNVQDHASKMFAMIFDIDGVTPSTLNNLLNGAFKVDAYPIPNYVVLSGHGIHLYYLFDYPIPLFPNIKLQLKELKFALTEKLWNMYTSTEETKQFQGINQGFRVVGGKTKKDAAEAKTRAFLLNTTPFTLRQLNEYVPQEHWIDEKQLFKESKMTLAAAKKKYPEWYEKVVVNKDRTPKKWDISGKVKGDNPFALYDWWLNKVKTGATYRHRYFSVMCLAIYGAKCDVPYDKVEQDALELIPFLNEINPEKPFTKVDVMSALDCYDLRYCTFPIRDIEKISGITIERNKRNGRKQDVHLRRARAVQREDYPNGEWREGNGRPDKARIVQQWRCEHPEGKKADCCRDTGLDPKTIRKWWNGTPSEENIKTLLKTVQTEDEKKLAKLEKEKAQLEAEIKAAEERIAQMKQELEGKKRG